MSQANEDQKPSLSPLHDLVEHSWSFAESYLGKDGKEIMTQFTAQTADGALNIYMTPWGNEAEKQWTLDKLRAHFAETNVQRYVMISEIWRVTYKGADIPDIRAGKHVMPSQHPNREECLMVLGVDPGAGEIMQFIAPIITEDGKRRLGERESPPHEGEASGRMIDLLGPFKRRAVQ